MAWIVEITRDVQLVTEAGVPITTESGEIIIVATTVTSWPIEPEAGASWMVKIEDTQTWVEQ